MKQKSKIKFMQIRKDKEFYHRNNKELLFIYKNYTQKSLNNFENYFIFSILVYPIIEIKTSFEDAQYNLNLTLNCDCQSYINQNLFLEVN